MSNLCFICSPYGGNAENIELARRFMRMAAGRKLMPVAPHVMLHGVLDDKIPEHRTAGLELGLEWLLPMCWELWLCGDTVSPGMALEKAAAEEAGIRVREVSLDQLQRWERLQHFPHRFMMYHDWQAGADFNRLTNLYQILPDTLACVLGDMLEVGEVSTLRERCV